MDDDKNRSNKRKFWHNGGMFMKVENISIRAYSEKAVNEKDNKENQEKKNKNVINASQLNFASGISAAEKRIEKERNALKIKLDQMMADEEYSNEMKSHLERQAELKEEVLSNQNEVEEIKRIKQTVKDAYGITDDSPEQKQLEEIEALREKEKSGERLTKEEIVRLSNREDLTDYQKLMLEYDDAIDEFKTRAEKAGLNAQAHGTAVESMKQALLQVHPMADASKAANEMILSALKEEQSRLVAEMKENYDAKVEEEKEKAEEVRAEREELQEAKEDNSNEVMEKLLEISTDISMEQNVLKQKGLLEEDLKGIEVDELV